MTALRSYGIPAMFSLVRKPTERTLTPKQDSKATGYRLPWNSKALRKAAGRIVTSLWAKSLP